MIYSGLISSSLAAKNVNNEMFTVQGHGDSTDKVMHIGGGASLMENFKNGVTKVNKKYLIL